MSQDLTASQARSLVADQLVGSAMTEREPIEGLVDASDRPEGGRVISWLNDIETDQQYARWPASAHQYLRPLYPGQMHMVRRNTWNAVLVLDLARPASFDAIVAQVGAMIMRNVPIRIGVVPLFKDKTDDCEFRVPRRELTLSGQDRNGFPPHRSQGQDARVFQCREC
jgi:UDP-glucose:glycoprotein glucosyltransferase